LLVHDSKTVRATLKAYLKACHTIHEAPDGDAGWHKLVLQSDLDTVIAGTDLGLLSGMALLERVRHNPLARLQKMFFYLIGSETRISALKEEALAAGVTGLLYNGMVKSEVLAVLGASLPQTSVPGPSGKAAKPGKLEKLAEKTEKAASALSFPGISVPPAAPAKSGSLKQGLREAGPMTSKLFADGVARLFSQPGRHGAVLYCTVEDYAALGEELGEKKAANIVDKLARLAQTRIGNSDIIGFCAPGSFAIATVGGNLEQCENFARHLKKGVASAKISARGKLLSISLCTAAAACPEDGDLRGEALLELARKRGLSALKGKQAPA
jgi:DNA-binding NarL/FixJ family response regulator/GGDEF domain-containing protein